MNNKIETIEKFIKEIVYFKNIFYDCMNKSIFIAFDDHAFNEEINNNSLNDATEFVLEEIKCKNGNKNNIDLTEEQQMRIFEVKSYIQKDIKKFFPIEKQKEFLYAEIKTDLLMFNLNKFKKSFYSLKNIGVNTLMIDTDFNDIENYFNYFNDFLDKIKDAISNKLIDFIDSEYIETLSFK